MSREATHCIERKREKWGERERKEHFSLCKWFMDILHVIRKV